MRRSIKEPIAEIFAAWESLSRAVDFHCADDAGSAAQHFERANSAEVWGWTNPGILKPHLNVVRPNPLGDTRIIPKPDRDPDRIIAPAIKAEVLRRDGYRCRYCGIPVVPAEVRKLAHQLYPNAVPWRNSAVSEQHAAFQCLWLQYDHVEPHSHGGRSSLENVVISCALCNYGKDRYTLRQLDLEDPRLHPPIPTDWDGLVRFLKSPAAAPAYPVVKSAAPTPKLPSRSAGQSAFFIVGAWISSGYLFTPLLAGKERWFKLGPDVSAEVAARDGITGCRLVCDAAILRRRGIDSDTLLDS